MRRGTNKRSQPLKVDTLPGSRSGSSITSASTEESIGISDFFSFDTTRGKRSTIDYTPPSSVPTSPPGSPEYGVRRSLESEDDLAERGGSTGANLRDDHSAGDSGGARIRHGSSRRSDMGGKTSRRSYGDDSHARDTEDECRSPILPKVKLAFPTIMSDDEDDTPIWHSQGDFYDCRNHSTRRRTHSSTTTIKRKVEVRTWRVSIPAFDGVNVSSGDSSPNSNSTIHQPHHSTNQLPFPSTSSNQGYSSRRPAASFSSASQNFNNDNLPPSRIYRNSLPSSYNREARRSHGGPLPTTSGPPLRPTRRSNPFEKIFRQDSTSSHSSIPRTRSHSHIPSSKSHLGSSKPNTPLKLPSISSHIPNMKPVFNAVFLVFVSFVACCSISAVLLAGFSLTFYDDCGRRLKWLKQGMEGINFKRVGSLLGERLEGWASGARRIVENRRGARKILDLDRREESSTGDGNKNSVPRNFSRGRSQSRRRKSSTPSIGGLRGLAKRFPFTSAFSSGASTPTSDRSFPYFFGNNLPNQQPGGGWISDDENLPYEIPNNTPLPSRPPSPSPTEAQSNSRNAPPRPPLSILIPSIIFALVYTFFKVAYELYAGARRKRKSSA